MVRSWEGSPAARLWLLELIAARVRGHGAIRKGVGPPPRRRGRVPSLECIQSRGSRGARVEVMLPGRPFVSVPGSRFFTGIAPAQSLGSGLFTGIAPAQSLGAGLGVPPGVQVGGCSVGWVLQEREARPLLSR